MVSTLDIGTCSPVRNAHSAPGHMAHIGYYFHCSISRVERKTGVSQMVVFPQT